MIFILLVHVAVVEFGHNIASESREEEALNDSVSALRAQPVLELIQS